MESIKNAISAGVIATFVVSALMQMNNAIGQFPDVHMVRTLGGVLGISSFLAAWGVYFILGMLVFASLFALIEARIPVRSYFVKGLLFGCLLWIGMMVVVMPLAGAGFFATYRSGVVPVATLVLNLVYGGVLASVYAWYMRPTAYAGQRR